MLYVFGWGVLFFSLFEFSCSLSNKEAVNFVSLLLRSTTLGWGEMICRHGIPTLRRDSCVNPFSIV